MSGSSDIGKLLRDMKPVLAEPVYVFCTLAERRLPPDLEAVCLFNESEGLTAIVELADAQRHGIEYEFAARMITLTIHSDLAAVGFLSVVMTQLAQAGIACNAVSGYYHDHLFVPQERVDDAMAALCALAGRFASGAGGHE